MMTQTYQFGQTHQFPETQTYDGSDWDEIVEIALAGYRYDPATATDAAKAEIEELTSTWDGHPAGSLIVYVKGDGFFVIVDR